MARRHGAVMITRAASLSISDRRERSMPLKVASVVVKDKRIAGQTLRQLRSVFKEEVRESVQILGLKRQGLPVPILLKTELRRGDVLERRLRLLVARRHPVQDPEVDAVHRRQHQAVPERDVAVLRLGLADLVLDLAVEVEPRHARQLQRLVHGEAGGLERIPG